MNLFGFEVRRSSPRVAVVGTDFHARSIISAAAPQAPRQDPQLAAPVEGVQWRRIVSADPREAWWLALPAKLLPKQVEQIKRAGLAGDVWQSWQLDSLMADSWPMYRKCVHELRQSVADSRWIVRPFSEEGEEPTPKAQEKAALVRRAMLSLQPDPFSDEKGFRDLIYNLCDAVTLGISLNELQWYDRNGENMVRATTWVHPRHFTFGDHGNLAILPNADVGTTLMFENNKPKPTMVKDFPGRFMCYQHMSKSGSSLSSGLLRPLATWWSYWIYGREWIAVMAQKHGTPFLKGKYQSGSMNQVEQNQVENRLRDAGANNYMLSPHTVDVEVVPAQALSKDNPICTLMRQADEAPQYLLLGQTATTTSTPGKLGGTDDTHTDVKKERVQALAGAIGACLTEQFAKFIIQSNYGDTDEVPVIEADFTEVASPEKQAARWSQLLMTQAPFAKSEFYKENSLTEPKEGDEVIQGGKITVFEGAKTADEMFEEDLNRQVQQAEASMALEGEAAGGGGNPSPDQKDAAKANCKRSNKLRVVLAKASDDELKELEIAIIKAERAPHKNGEVDELKGRVINLAGKRRI